MTELTYTQNGDYLMPDLTAEVQSQRIGKYGMIRLKFLKNNRRSLYSAMKIKGTLMEHLTEMDKIAREQVEGMVSQMAQAESVTEQMKADNPLEWTRRMNNFKHSAEEIVISSLLHS
ncbi:TnpV protein [Oscillospiraceae bacterium DSM 107454]|uniref:TnpV protein n=2 Tax=Ructibacterium gallinarum TaxID=2779355 RepID=A0A9D5LZN4_9FIRM|nr:TnpV protein [Ructibacterium gallinarum]